MASESTEETAVTVSLAPELEEWLDARATDLGVDRETVLVRLAEAHRDAAALGAADDVEGLAAALANAEPVREAVEATVAAAVERALDEREPVGDEGGAVESVVRDQVESAMDERLHDEVAVAVERVLDDRVDGVRADFRAKLEDVRERVVQLKRETDAKAAADHTHEGLARVDDLDGRVADAESLERVEDDLADLERTVDAIEEERQTTDAAVETELAELQDRLKTVAWVASDLREAYEAAGGSAALERLKRSAAEADAARAACERCGEGVEIGLLTKPECPHCEATVTEVAPKRGFFGKPRLLAASQLESGDGR